MIVNESVLSLGVSLLALFIAGLLATKVNQSLTAVFIVVGMILQNFFPVTIITEFIATLGILFILFIIYVTSSVIVAKSIIDLKRSANPETEYILNVLIFEDMFIATFLAFIVGIVNYGQIDAKSAFIVILKTSAFFALFIVLAKTSKKFINKIIDIEHTELFVILILAIIVLSAGAASYVGLSEAIGAFLAGLLLAKTQNLRGNKALSAILHGNFLRSIWNVN